MDAVRKEIDKQLGSTDDDAEAGSWDYAVATALGVVGPLLEKTRDYAVVSGYDLGVADLESRLAASQADVLEGGKAVDLLLWLHAEAAWWLQLDRDEHESAEILHMWSKRVAYLEARVGELKNTIGELRAETANRLEVGDRLGWRLVEARQEIDRLRREVRFWANGADTFSGADARHASGPQCSVHPDGGDRG